VRLSNLSQTEPEIFLTEAVAVDDSSQNFSYRQPSGWTLDPELD
jgi:hypothetical protein